MVSSPDVVSERQNYSQSVDLIRKKERRSVVHRKKYQLRQSDELEK